MVSLILMVFLAIGAVVLQVCAVFEATADQYDAATYHMLFSFVLFWMVNNLSKNT